MNDEAIANRQPALIGLNGRFRSGKDEFYYLLRDQLKLQAKRLAFGDAIKAELGAALGVSVSQIEREKERYRAGIQWWADYRRQDNHSYWIRFVRSRWEQYRQSRPAPLVVVVTDVRDIPEARFIRDQGGVIVRVVRPLSWRERLRIWRHHPLRAVCQHRTETAMDKFKPDYEVVNDGSVEDYRRKVWELWERLS